MKKYVIGLLAAIVSAGVFAVGSEGDIRSIEAVSSAQVIYPNDGATGHSRPLKVGETFYVLVRLLNSNWQEAIPSAPVTHEWMIKRNTESLPADWKTTVYWPGLRIAIGDKRVTADYSAKGPNGESSGLNGANGKMVYTDLYFSYTVKEGELGLPVRLVDAEDKIVASSGDGSSGFCFVNVNTVGRTGGYWDLTNDLLDLANFKYGPSSLDPDPSEYYPAAPAGGEKNSLQRIEPGIFVKTIDFEGTYVDQTPAEEDDWIWREVYQGLGDNVGRAPAVKGTGPATVYIWSEDEAIAVPDGDPADIETGVDFGDGVPHTVLSVTLGTGDDIEKSFRLKGGDTAAIGATTRIFMCSTKGPAMNASHDVIPGSTLVRRVQIKQQPDPYIAFTDVSGNQSFEIQASTNRLLCTQMKMTFLKAFPGGTPVKVKLSAKVGTTDIDPIGDKFMVFLSTESDPTVAVSLNEITMPADAKEVYFYVYALGTCKEILDNRVTLTPTLDPGSAAEAFFVGDARPASIMVNNQKPVVSATLPASGFQYDDISVNVMVKDSYRDLSAANTNGYKVTIFLAGQSVCESNEMHFTENTALSFPVKIPAEGMLSGYVKVQDAVGEWSDEFPISIEAKAPLTVTPRIFTTNELGAEPDSRQYYAEGEVPFLRFVFSSAVAQNMYAFVVPMDSVSSNLIETTALTNGLLVEAGSPYPTLSDAATIRLKDGDCELLNKVRLSVILKDNPDFNAADANVISTYSSKSWSFWVTNVNPRIDKVWKGTASTGTRIYPGDIKNFNLPSGSPVTFTAKIDDDGKGDMDDNERPITVRWVWTDGPDGENIEQSPVITTNANGYAICPITFYEAGSTQTISLYAQDRDMRKVDPDEYGELLFTFQVTVGDSPRVVLEYPQGVIDGRYYEPATYDPVYKSYANKTYNNLVVKLSDFPGSVDHAVGQAPIGTTNPLKVKLTIDNSYHSDSGELWFLDEANGNQRTNEVIVSFTKRDDAVVKGKKVYFDLAGQNGGEENPSMFVVSATVINTTSNQYNTAWCDYFQEDDKEVNVYNVPPMITVKSGDSHSFSVTNNWTAGEEVTLTWSFTDIYKDVTNGHAYVEWTLANTELETSVTITNGWPIAANPAVGKATATGTWKFTVPDSPLTEVRVTADDGDGGTDEYVFYIKVVTTKRISITPFGPAESTQTKYISEKGVGQGHIYVDDSTGRYTVRQFIQTWHFNESAKQAVIYAAGYPATNSTAAVDNGLLGQADGYTGAAISRTGNKGSAGNYYRYMSDYDSYFYCWAMIEPESGAVTLYAPTPTVRPETAARKTFSLDNEKSEEGGYGIVDVEAIFSREWRRHDNLGDINADGIPDVVVQSYKLDGDNSQVSATDCADRADMNDDADYLPGRITDGAMISAAGIAYDAWSTPFDALSEIRGSQLIGAGYDFNGVLENVIKGVVGSRNYVEDPAESTLSVLEYIAFTNWCGRQATPLDPADSANWKLWSPERLTDPTKLDTDKDGYPDGYEYYFWYKAHVGYLDNGVYRRLEGRRYDPVRPMEPQIITADEIEAMFDPRHDLLGAVQKFDWSTQDTDNDGLPDYLEFQLGTNPLDYDTDGDGLPDGYEVMLDPDGTVFDPLMHSTDHSRADGSINPDRDSMAIVTIAKCEVLPYGADGGTNYIYTAADGKTYDAWRYYGKNDDGAPYFCRGRELSKAYVDGITPGEPIACEILVLHFDVYQDHGFDPRTAWNVPPAYDKHILNSRPFTALDEFLLMAWYHHIGGLAASDMVASADRPMTRIWTRYSTNPLDSDTDKDGMPDGWELYVQAGPRDQGAIDSVSGSFDETVEAFGPACMYSPLEDFAKIAGTVAADPDPAPGGDGLDFPHEYSGVESVAVYSEVCETIKLLAPEWKNKIWPTDPWNGDTDDDGISDGEEGKAFIYGDHEHTAGGKYEDAVPGGGLNPLSWDTDYDNLPDPWELEFAGSVTIKTGADTTTVVDNGNGTSTTNTVAGATTETWGGGMNGTVSDAMEDYDNDGLKNWQEYMVGTMRCWRYDDTITTWHCHEPNPNMFSNDEYMYNLLVNPESNYYNPGMRAWHCHPGVYMSWSNNAWDFKNYGKFYYLKDGIYHDLKLDAQDGSKDYQNRWHRRVPPIAPFRIDRNYPAKYICCNPAKADTDEDGMDDYYELFHGLNPLLGDSVDIVYDSWNIFNDGTAWSSGLDYWTEFELPFPEFGLQLKGVTDSTCDFVQWPWKAGSPTADPDGDNIRNIYESIQSHMQAESTYLHSDPTPLWMTDISYQDSLTFKYYYNADPYWNLGGIQVFPHDTGKFTHTWKDADGVVHSETYNLNDFPWLHWDADEKVCEVDYDINYWNVLDYMFSFEQSEGYDTDDDYLGDFEEAQGKTKSASNPIDHDDPIRRQAMYFGGDADPGFLQTSLRLPEMGPNGGVAAGDQPFLYFTVECWAKADAAMTADHSGRHTLVERPIWTGQANAADESYLRKNFLIGVNDGRWYTMFQSAGTDARQTIEITDGPHCSTNWTHIAATYDGEALRLYVNGVCRNVHKTSIQPEHGVASAYVEVPDQALRSREWSDTSGTRAIMYPLNSILIGASANCRRSVTYNLAFHERSILYAAPGNPLGYLLDDMAEMSDYDSYFKGYIDEVRIWDGARNASQINQDVQNLVRYTSDTALECRDKIKSELDLGYGRSGLANGELSADLMYHWSFDHISGAVDPADLIDVPAGFRTSKATTDGMAIWSRPEGWESYWLRRGVSDSIRSKYYTDLAWIPWIHNTVIHLPYADGRTADSLYWAEFALGGVPAASNGVSRLEFKRDHEPVAYWQQMLYVKGGGMVVGQTYPTFTGSDYEFSLRERYTEGCDLLPFGGAYAKRISAAEGGMWDKQGAADAWAETGDDSDHNGLPNWWERYARQNLSPDLAPMKPFRWDTTVVYNNGAAMPAWQAYLRDLAKGLLPDGKIHPEYADTRDADGDAIPDWWEDMYGVNTNSKEDTDADPDMDGLSNYQEYVLSEVYPEKYDLAQYLVNEDGTTNSVVLLNPALPYTMTNQVVTDYFLSYALNKNVAVTNFTTGSHWFMNEYFGEIATDHDFMENWWENSFPQDYTSAFKYDPAKDYDGDGWSTWAECRSSLWNGYFLAGMIDRWTGTSSDTFVPCHPEPVFGLKVTYFGSKDISGQQLVVRTKSGIRQRMDAKFVVPPTVDGHTKYLGMFEADTRMHGHMSPGMLNENSIIFERALTSSDKNYLWNCTWYKENTPDEFGWEGRYWSDCHTTHTGSFEQYSREFKQWPRIEMESGDLSWEAFAEVRIVSGTDDLDIVINGITRVGTVNLRSGEFEIDMSKVTGEGKASEYVYRVTYSCRSGHEWPQTVYLSDTKEFDQGAQVLGDGYTREGKNVIEAFIDLNGDLSYTEGEPYGFVQGVDFGWHRKSPIVLELKDESMVVPRTIIPQIQIGSDDKGGKDGKQDSGDTLDAGTASVVIRRKTINGSDAFEDVAGDIHYVPERTFIRKEFRLDDRDYLTEADVLTSGRFDLDDKWLVSDALVLGLEQSDIRRVGYDIEQVIELPDGSVTNVVFASFVNEFAGQRAKAVPVAPIDGAAVYSASPVLKFSTSDLTMKGYRLQVRLPNDQHALTNSYDETNSALVYDSLKDGGEICLLPGRETETVGRAVYAINPPIFAGSPVTTNGSPVFVDGSNYVWRIALYNAKYSDTPKDEDWGAWSSFRLDVGNHDRYPVFPSGYGNCTVGVRYYGASLATNIRERVVVEAFDTADFRGQPLARVRLFGTNEVEDVHLRDIADVTTPNARFYGIPQGKVYLRAYIDFNNNGRRDDWESWGYANMVGTSMKAIYNPDEFIVSPTAHILTPATESEKVIYIEDCDVNQNEYPDCIEDVYLNASGDGVSFGSDTDGDGLNDDEEPDIGTDPSSWDTDSDGMPDGWEAKFADLDPTYGFDADEVAADDVMAYAEVSRRLVTVWDGKDESSARIYILDKNSQVPVVGDIATNLDLYAAYNYGRDSKLKGLGAPVTLTNVAYVAKVTTEPIALVHDQVYAEFGFNQLTATPEGLGSNGAHTKPFTALDKYLVVRYLESKGVVTEDEVNRGRKWGQYTLKPHDTDYDRDGVPDGWELYIGSNPWLYADRDSDTDNDGLRLVEEYDHFRGSYASDPNAIDSDGDGVTDRYAYWYMLKGDDSAKDPDGDGLSNYAEYLISEVFGFAKLDPLNPMTDGACLDYFRKVGELYFGEIFTDHDQMNDDWEDRYGAPWTASSVFDPYDDFDDDGWSNIAEAFAGTDPTVAVRTTEADTNGNVSAAIEFPVPEIKVTVVYNGNANVFNGNTIVKAWTDPDMVTIPDAIWKCSIAQTNSPVEVAGTTVTYTLRNTVPIEYSAEGASAGGKGESNGQLVHRGGVREGRNTFVVFVDLDGDNAYTPGEPFGCVKDIDIGWKSNQFSVEVTDTNPIFARLNITDASNDREVKYGDQSGNWYDIDEGHLSGGDYERVRVVRTLVNEIGLNQPSIAAAVNANGIGNRVVFDKWIDTANCRKIIHEGDFFGNGSFDIDWNNLLTDVVNPLKSFRYSYTVAGKTYNTTTNIDVTAVTYRIVLGGGTIDLNTTNNLVGIAVTRHFDGVNARKTPRIVDVNGGSGIVYGSSPVFRWSMEYDGVNYNTYTAFRLQVQSGSTTVYDTGLRMAPPRDSEGNYVFQAPGVVGSKIAASGSFTWRVAMYNAKFKDDRWSSNGSFITAANLQQDVNDHGYSSINVCVKYAGPATVLSRCNGTSATGKVVVQAYESPDFSGDPIAQTYVTDQTELSDTSRTTTNGTLVGLPVNGTYYLRAFIDSNGNGYRDDFESWGYYKESVSLKGRINAPLAGFYIEDCDTDGDWLPDAWEYAMAGWTGNWATVKNTRKAAVDPTGKVLFSTTAFNNATNRLANISTGARGATLTILENGSLATTLLPGSGLSSGTWTIDSIRAAVEHEVAVKESSVKVTAIAVDYANSLVHIYVDADVAPTVAGELLGRIYSITPGSTKTVKIKISKKDSLAQADWEQVMHAGDPDGYWTATVGAGDVRVDVDISDEVDINSGFYKIDIIE